MDPSDAGRAGIFSRWTHRMEDVWVYSHDGPIGPAAPGAGPARAPPPGRARAAWRGGGAALAGRCTPPAP
eukprot:5573968-Pyramimonas_sp.AAC.1